MLHLYACGPSSQGLPFPYLQNLSYNYISTFLEWHLKIFLDMRKNYISNFEFTVKSHPCKVWFTRKHSNTAPDSRAAGLTLPQRGKVFPASLWKYADLYMSKTEGLLLLFVCSFVFGGGGGEEINDSSKQTWEVIPESVSASSLGQNNWDVYRTGWKQ